MGKLKIIDIKQMIIAYQFDLKGKEVESDIAAKLGHHAHCIVCTSEIKLIKNFISDLSKLII